MKTIKILLVLFCILPTIVCAQNNKQFWNQAELIDAQGQTIHTWQAESFTQIIIQKNDHPCMEVCFRRLLIISSGDPKVLQMISPSSVFDASTIRSFEQMGSIEKADRDSTHVVYKLEFKAINYPDRIVMFSDSTESFMMLMSNKNIALVLYNKNK